MEKKYRGMTLKQIDKALGENTKKSNKKTIIKKIKKSVKPKNIFKKEQKNDPGLVLDLPFFSIDQGIIEESPDWFYNNKKTNVSVIVPLYNSNIENIVDTWDFKNNDLRSELVFVDDGCSGSFREDIIKLWETRIEEIKKPIGKIIKNRKKQGWGASCNIGAYHSKGEILIFLRPDAKLFTDWMYQLVKTIRKPEVGLVGGLHVNEEEDTVINAGKEWDWKTERFLKIGSEVFKGNVLSNPFKLNNVPLEIFNLSEREFISSDLMAVKKCDFVEQGGFSYNLFSKNWSDADLCARFLEKKYKILYQPNSKIYTKNILELDEKEKHGECYFQNKWINSKKIDNLIKSKRIKEIKKIKKIIIKLDSSKKDILIASSFVESIKNKYKDSEVIFSTSKYKNLLENNPNISNIVNEFSERQFDLFFNLDMVREYRPYTNILDAYADYFGLTKEDSKFHIPDYDFKINLNNYIVIHANCSTWMGRDWSRENFDEISKKIKEKNYNIICIGSKFDHKTSFCDLDLREKTSFEELSSVIRKSKLFIGVDAFPMYVAQALDKEGVCFFGSTNPQTQIINKKMKPVRAEGLKCLGCQARFPAPCFSVNICELKNQECITKVSADKMWKHIEESI